MVNTWILSPAPASRKSDVEALWQPLRVKPEHRVVVTTQPDPITDIAAHLVLFNSTEWNISKWWTAGLDYIAAHETDKEYNVFLVESDVRIAYWDFQELAFNLRTKDVGCIGVDWNKSLNSGDLYYPDRHKSVPLKFRLPGIALMVRGELGVRHDPQFRWWFADDDFEWQHRKKYGSVLLGGTTLTHNTGTPLTGNLLEWSKEDLIKFKQKWNFAPTSEETL